MRLTAERLWIAGGVAAAVLLLAVGWFFAISPQYSSADDLNSQADTASDQVTILQHRLTALRRQNADLAQYTAQLAKERAALPTSSGLSDLLRELQSAGDLTNTEVSGVTVGEASSAGSQLYSLPLNLTVKGTVTTLHAFLEQLQEVQPRAVLISGASLSTSVGTPPSSLSLTLEAFVAAPVATAPTATAPVATAPTATATATASPSTG